MNELQQYKIEQVPGSLEQRKKIHSGMVALSPKISLKCSKKSQILQHIQVENQRTNIVLRST